MSVIRAKVLTNSSEDANARVKLECPGIFNESPLIESVGGIPLKKGDIVYVDITEGLTSSLILGRSFDKSTKFHKQIQGSILFESSDSNMWTICYVKNDKFFLENSSGFKISVEGSSVQISGAGASLKLKTLPVSKPFCSIQNCLYAGTPHTTDTVNLL